MTRGEWDSDFFWIFKNEACSHWHQSFKSIYGYGMVWRYGSTKLLAPTWIATLSRQVWGRVQTSSLQMKLYEYWNQSAGWNLGSYKLFDDICLVGISCLMTLFWLELQVVWWHCFGWNYKLFDAIALVGTRSLFFISFDTGFPKFEVPVTTPHIESHIPTPTRHRQSLQTNRLRRHDGWWESFVNILGGSSQVS